MAIFGAIIYSISDPDVWYLQEKHQLFFIVLKQNWQKQQTDSLDQK